MSMTERKPPKAFRANLLDRAILAVAPMWGTRRLAVRYQWHAAEAKQDRFARIEAAETNDSRGDRWLVSRLSSDSQLELDLETTRERSRDIYQNDALGGAVDGKVNHVIGTGHKPQSRVRASDGIVSESEAAAINKELELVHERWNQGADRTGRRSLWMLSRLAARHNEFDGESFTVLSGVSSSDRVIPLAVQVIDPERVNTPMLFASDPLVRLGIRQSKSGDIVGYYVQRSHPGDTKDTDLGYDFIQSDRMLHVFEPWFAGQSRGLPWMTRALNRARDAKDYDEATILGAQIEQCFAGFVKPSMTSGLLSAEGMGSGTNAAGNRLQDIIPGTLTHLDPGEEISFSAPTRPGNGFTPFMEWNYRRVAAAINWPYEMIVKNWTGLSFATGRLVLTDAKKATEVGQKMMLEMWFARIWNRIVEESVIVGEVSISPALYLANTHVFQRHVWIPPRWEYALKPSEDVDADVTEVAQNFATIEDKLAKRGYDLEEFVERKVREKELFESAGLSLPTTPQGGAPGSEVEPADDKSEPVEANA